MNSTLIKNALIYDGVSRKPKRADILFDAKKIRTVRPRLRARDANIIDASGHAIIPGIIDANSSIDQYGGLFSDALQKQFISRGITAVITGGNGISLAPFREKIIRTFFYPEDPSLGNADWVSFQEYKNTLKKQRLRLHVGSMAGYRNICSPLASSAEIRRETEKTLEEGALGISFDWDDAISHPLSPRNLEAASKVLAAAKKVCALRLDVSRHSPGMLHMFSRMFARLGAKLHISRFRPHASAFQEWESGDHPGKYADIAASPWLPYPIYGFLPPSFRRLEFDEMNRRIRLPEYEKEILKHLRSIPIAEIIIARLPHDLRHLEGKAFRDLSFHLDLPLAETFLHCMRSSGLKAVLAIKNSGPGNTIPFLRHPSSVLSTGGILPLVGSLRGSDGFRPSAFPALATSSGLLPGEIIAKMTSVPANVYGLPRRGKIVEGYHADLAVLKNWDVKKVFVGGRLAFQNGIFEDMPRGAVL